mmetsp:Transcript_91676/g.186606  ORF Transcript_91676/g.186606 Transcript_91676/m.186606 type:complete len:219 (+) Transcript_91676:34-690(+)
MASHLHSEPTVLMVTHASYAASAVVAAASNGGARADRAGEGRFVPGARSLSKRSFTTALKVAVLCRIHSTWYWRIAMSKLLAPPLSRRHPLMNSSMSTSPLPSRSRSLRSVATCDMSSPNVLMKVTTFSSSIWLSNSSRLRVPLPSPSSSAKTRCTVRTKSTFCSISCCTRSSRSLCDRCIVASTKTAVTTLRSARIAKVMKTRKASLYSEGNGRRAT